MQPGVRPLYTGEGANRTLSQGGTAYAEVWSLVCEPCIPWAPSISDKNLTLAAGLAKADILPGLINKNKKPIEEVMTPGALSEDELLAFSQETVAVASSIIDANFSTTVMKPTAGTSRSKAVED